MTKKSTGLQSIDRRWIYLVMLISLLVSLYIARPVTPVVMEPVQNLFDTVDQAKAGPGDGKLILVGTTFSPSTMGESGNQLRALLRHLMLQHKRFALISVGEFQGAILGYSIAQEIADQYGYQYGKDWISLGFQLNSTAFYISFPRDIPGVVGKDYTGRRLREFPIMQGIKTVRDDIALFVDVTASASVYNWIMDVQGRHPLKIGYACTGVMTAEAYPYLDSGQLVGVLPGLKGAADYEQLVDELEQKQLATGEMTHAFDYTKGQVIITPARKLMFTQNIAHLVIILFIILGNIGLVLSRRRAKTDAKENA